MGRFLWLLCGVLGIALLVAACGGDDDQTSTGTADEVIEPAADTVAAPSADAGEEDPTAVTTDNDAANDEAAVDDTTYSDLGIHAILEDNCATCHAPGGPGATHMELDTAVDAVVYAEDIALFTATREMPPWPASDLSVDFVDNHSLSDDQIASIQGWYEAGGSIDVDPDTPIVSTKPLRAIDDPDLVLTSANGPYQGSPEVVDDYRCLIFDPELDQTEWILSSQFVPDQVEVVHHGIISVASKELREQAEQFDAAEEGPGWTCYGGTGLRAANGGYEFRMGGWAPGAQPATQPDGYAIPLRPGDFVIVQIHYHFDNEAPPDLSSMVFDLADDADLAAAGGSFKTLRGQLYLGPAEIPCYEGDTDPLCDRSAALERVGDLYGRFGAALPDYFLAQCGSKVADYAEMTDGDAWSTCDLAVGNPGRIVSLTGHMHELGKSIRLTLNPDTPEERILLDIPDWNFEWQFGYRPVEDIIIDADDVIRVDCAWNRERAPYEAVGYILWAEGTGDEMCYSSITTAPVT